MLTDLKFAFKTACYCTSNHFTLTTNTEKPGSTVKFVNLIAKTNEGNNERQDHQQVIKLQTFIELLFVKLIKNISIQ